MPRKRHTDIAETPASGPILPDRVQANNPADTDEQLATEVEELRRQVVELHELKDEDQRAIRDWEWLARLVDENPDPVLRVSLHGAILYRNPAAVPLCRQWNPDDELIVPEAIRKLVFAAYGGAKVIHREMAFGEHTYLVTVAPAAPAPAKYINIYARDITGRKQAETALRERIKELACLHAVSRDIQQGLSVDELCRRAVEHLVHAMQFPEITVPVIELNGRRFTSERYAEGLPDGLQAQIRVGGEVLGHLTVHYAQKRPFLIPEEQNLVNGVAEALSTWLERKQAEEALHELNVTLETRVAERTEALEYRTRQLQKLTVEHAQTEDRERKRMAEILHGDLQQILAAAKFHLSMMRNRVKQDASLQALGAQIDEMLKEAIEKSRSLAHELSPAVLHHSDFTEILRWLAGQIEARYGLAVHVRADGKVDLPSDTLTSLLYRTVQELLFNVVKHARVNEARIVIRQRGHCVYLSVSDQGRGFDPQRLQETAGFGLLSIRERVELLGGRVKIKSAPGQGRSFLIVVPAGETVVRSRTAVVGERKAPADGRLPATDYLSACCWRTITGSCGRACACR
jgi:signal transduction histidine kinase